MVSLLKTDHRANGQSRAQSLLVFRSAGQARRIWVRDRQKAYFKISNRDPHDQRELADLCKIPKFGVYPGPILDEIQSLKKHQCQRPAIHIFLNKFFKFLNGCMFFNICPISTKLMDFVKLGVFFLTTWVIMHWLVPSPPRFETSQWYPTYLVAPLCDWLKIFTLF